MHEMRHDINAHVFVTDREFEKGKNLQKLQESRGKQGQVTIDEDVWIKNQYGINVVNSMRCY